METVAECVDVDGRARRAAAGGESGVTSLGLVVAAARQEAYGRAKADLESAVDRILAGRDGDGVPVCAGDPDDLSGVWICVGQPESGPRLCCRWYAELPAGIDVDVDSFALNSADGDWGDVEDTAVDLTPAQRRKVAARIASQVTDHYADRVAQAVDAFASARERLDSLLARAVESGVPKTRAAKAASITRQTLNARTQARVARLQLRGAVTAAVVNGDMSVNKAAGPAGVAASTPSKVWGVK